MRYQYSRLAKTEEKRNLRKAFLYVFLSIASLLLLIFFGIPALAKMAAFLSNLRSSSQPVEKNDITPPAPARFETIPEFTNKQNLDIKGFAEAGASVKLFANNRTEEVIVNNEGYFIYTFALNKGENTLSSQVMDKASNQSQNSGEVKIFYDDEPPEVEITTPQDGTAFYGSRQRQITIEGTTKDAVQLLINGRIVTLEETGNFTYSVTLEEGENNFEIIAKDTAGNETIERITVQFWR